MDLAGNRAAFFPAANKRNGAFMKTRWVKYFVLGIIFCSYQKLARGETKYNVLDLGNYGAISINDQGQIAGVLDGLPAIWQNGNWSSLGQIGKGPYYVTKLNDFGQIVGFWEPLKYQAFVFKDGQYIQIDDLNNSYSSGAEGINNAGTIVGWLDSNAQDLVTHAFLWKKGNLTLLDTDSENNYNVATAINNVDQVAGVSGNKAVVWENGTLIKLGTLGGAGSSAMDINDLGQVVGLADTGQIVENGSAVSHGFLWENGAGMTDLGTFGGLISLPLAINNSTQVVGYAQTASGQSHAFLWEQAILRDLNDFVPTGFGWELTCANDINNLGQIIVSGRIEKGDNSFLEHSFLLTPIPEPEISLLISIGFSFITGGYLRKIMKK